MRLLKLLLSSSIIYIATNIHTIAMGNPTDKKSDIVQCNALNYNLSDNIFPLHYNIKLSFVHYDFVGEYVITIYIIYATQHINFHLSNLIIKSIISLKSILKQTHSRMIYEPTNYNFKTNIVLCNFNATILPGIYNLHIRFEIPINIVKESFGIPYINENGHKEWLITTGIQTRKQQIFPFWNKPELRITFDISIKHYRSYEALSNMPIRGSEPLCNETWTHFNKTVLNSIDNVAFVMFDFHRINLTDTISIWCRPQMVPYVKFASYIIENITMHFENYWNNSKRFLEWTIVSSESKVDHVAIPNLQDEVKQQVVGFVFHRETDIMYNEELDSTGHKMIIAPLVARRMIQKYIGNLLCPSYWFQLWLNEGFIMFLQPYIINEIITDFQMIDLFIVQVQHELLDLNTYINISSVIEYDNYPENYTYTFLSHVKGSIIWRMLERTLSPSIFSKGINIYLNQYAEPMETTSDNLWNAMQSIIDKLDSEYQFNIKNTVYSWAMQRCFPVLEVMRNYSNNSVTISAQFHNKLDEKQYYIPITYTTEQNPNFTTTWSNIWLTPSNSKIELILEKDQWIILNLQQAGYFRVNYDTENWRKIARYLNSEEYRNIHVLNRAQIIDDAFHFAIEKKLEFSVFWELAIYLRKEEDYIAWYPMIKAFEFMSNIVAFLEFHPEFKEVQKPLELEWNLFSKDSNDDHTECLKQELAKWKCVMHDVPCSVKAYQQLQWYLIDLNKNKLSPGWKRWTYCNGLKLSSFSTRNRTFNFSMKQIDYTILECLSYSESFQIIFNYLEEKLPASFETFRHIFMTNLSYNKSKSIERTEALIANIFLSTLAKNTKYMLKDILNNFRKFTYYYGTVNEMAVLTVIINNVYSEEQLGEIREFIRNEIRESRYPFKALDAIERKIETRWSEIKRQTEFLQSLFTN